MCGIAGIFDPKRTRPLEVIEEMTDLLTHRGPDRRGTYTEPELGIALGHRRLSILDLSDTGAQPMRSLSGRSIMVYNGEAYNFKELAAKYNITTQSSGDTAVLLELIESHGIDILKEVNGMFALAFYSIADNVLYLARDHMGIKPLYFFRKDERLIFASELRSIRAASQSLMIDEQSVRHFLELGFFPKQETVYQNVTKLEPGSYLCASSSGIRTERYIPSIATNVQAAKLSQDDHGKRFSTLFSDAVRGRMISDRPMGVFLSGGTDSSLVTAYAREFSDGPLKTFSIAVKQLGYDESDYSEKVAEHLKTSHETISIHKDDLIHGTQTMLGKLDEPFGDSSFIPFYVLSEHAVQSFNVALSGDGADELFQGYGMYAWAERLSKLRYGTHKPVGLLVDKLFSTPEKNYGKYFDYKEFKLMAQNLFGQEQCAFHRSELDELLPTVTAAEKLVYDMDSCPAGMSSYREKQAWLDFQHYLVDDLLLKVDKASMYNSLEVRVPFLDRSMVEFAWSLPVAAKYKDKVAKRILKNDLERFLPKDLVHRKKWGFSIPLKEWLSKELDYLVTPLLDKEYLSLIPWIESEKVISLVRSYLGGSAYLYNRVWLLIQLYQWAHRHPESIYSET